MIFWSHIVAVIVAVFVIGHNKCEVHRTVCRLRNVGAFVWQRQLQCSPAMLTVVVLKYY